jgi:hypothetical protein
MSVPEVSTGRGAWSTVGKLNGSRYYEYIAGKPLDGSSASRDVNFQAVNLGVKAIQERINSFGYSPGLIADGVLGKGTREGIIWVQKRLGLYADGRAGTVTMQALWRDYLVWFGGVYSVPAAHMYGFMMLESVGDPGAVGYVTPSDRGLNQINLVAHPNITVEQAFDPVFSINYTAQRLSQARSKYSGKTIDLKTKCSIAQHNAPVYADQWYQTGSPPNTKIATYVDKVLEYATKF